VSPVSYAEHDLDLPTVVHEQYTLVQNNASHRSAGAEVFHYSGMVDAFRTIVRTEGFRGLFRGIDAAVPRVMVGSAAQLSSYSSCKVRSSFDSR
jgi:Mitochondrial carrier protein